MPQLYSIRRIFSRDPELMVFDEVTVKDGTLTARRGKEHFQIYISSFEPLGDTSLDVNWAREESELKAEAEQFKQREQRRIAEAHDILADEYDKEQLIRDQDDANELRHNLEVN